MALLPEIALHAPSAAPPIQTKIITELHELKSMLVEATQVLAQISDRIQRLEHQL